MFRFADSVCTENEMLRIENLALRAEVARLSRRVEEFSRVMMLYSRRLHQVARPRLPHV